jgi:hypothetical protein
MAVKYPGAGRISLNQPFFGRGIPGRRLFYANNYGCAGRSPAFSFMQT